MAPVFVSDSGKLHDCPAVTMAVSMHRKGNTESNLKSAKFESKKYIKNPVGLHVSEDFATF